MRKLIPIPLLLALILASGCATTGTGPDPIQITTSAIQVVVPIGVQYAASKDANCIPYLRMTVQVLNAASANGQYSPAQLIAAMEASSANSFKTPLAQASVMAGIGLYQGLLQAQVINSTQAVEIINALAAAIQSGLPPLDPAAQYASPKARRK
jgi:hypothetical protein